MPTPEKAQIIAETTARFQESKGVYFTKYTGMNVLQATSLRKEFRDNDIEYVITKNTLTRIAAKEAGLEGKFDDILVGQIGLSYLFLTLFIASNLILFGGVYWSKFAHMFYKPGAAIQKNLAEADGSRDNLPPPADAPEQFGLGIKREEPKHY